MVKGRPDVSRGRGQERHDHGVQRPIDMDIAPIRPIARILQHLDCTGNIVMRPGHRGAAGQRQDDRLAVQARQLFRKIGQVDLSDRVGLDLPRLDAQDPGRLRDRVMRLGAVKKHGIRLGLASQIQRPEISFGAACTDRAPVVRQIVAAPQPHQPADCLLLQPADL